MNGTNSYWSKLRKVYAFAKPLAPDLPYHNMPHMIDVARAAKRYAEMEGLNYQQSFILETAGLLHDIVYVPGRKDNERKSAELAAEVLPGFGYCAGETKEVGRLILATEMPTKPRDIMEMIICDSDIDNVGRDDYFEKSEAVRQETGIDEIRWYTEICPKFLGTVEYYTESARKIRSAGLKKNMKKLEGLEWQNCR